MSFVKVNVKKVLDDSIRELLHCKLGDENTFKKCGTFSGNKFVLLVATRYKMTKQTAALRISVREN